VDALQVFDSIHGGLLNGAMAASDHLARRRQEARDRTLLERWVAYAEALERDNEKLKSLLENSNQSFERCYAEYVSTFSKLKELRQRTGCS
jgi:hypothetical protein